MNVSECALRFYMILCGFRLRSCFWDLAEYVGLAPNHRERPAQWHPRIHSYTQFRGVFPKSSVFRCCCGFRACVNIHHLIADNFRIQRGEQLAACKMQQWNEAQKGFRQSRKVRSQAAQIWSKTGTFWNLYPYLILPKPFNTTLLYLLQYQCQWFVHDCWYDNILFSISWVACSLWSFKEILYRCVSQLFDFYCYCCSFYIWIYVPSHPL